MKKEYPVPIIGIIIVNSKGEVLIKKRKGADVLMYSIPGGHIELGETFEQAAIRETKEETDLEIIDPKVIAIVNALETYQKEGVHYVGVVVLAKEFWGEVKNNEPDYCEELIWCDPRELPQPHFDGSRLSIECYLKSSFYEGIK